LLSNPSYIWLSWTKALCVGLPISQSLSGGGIELQPRSKQLPCDRSMSHNRIIIMASTNDFNLRCPGSLVLPLPALSPPHWPSCGVAFFHFTSLHRSPSLSPSFLLAFLPFLPLLLFCQRHCRWSFALLTSSIHSQFVLFVSFRFVLFSALFRLSSRLFEVMLNVSLLSLCKSFYTNEICAKWR